MVGEQSRTGSPLKTALSVHSPASSEDEVLGANLIFPLWDPLCILWVWYINVSPNNGGCFTAMYPNHLLAFDPVALCFSPVNVPWLSSVTRALQACVWGEGAGLWTLWSGPWCPCSDELAGSGAGPMALRGTKALQEAGRLVRTAASRGAERLLPCF